MAAGAGGSGENVEQLFSTNVWKGTEVSGTDIVNGIDLSTEGGMVWIKSRGSSVDHVVNDTVRGANNHIKPNSNTDNNTASGYLTGFNTNGFEIGTESRVNNSSYDYASWTFRKAPKFFDVVTYTGNGTSSRQISHDLGATVGMTIVKCTSNSQYWHVLHRSGNAAKTLYLNRTDAEVNDTYAWNSTHATSTHFTVGAGLNTSGRTYVAYLFAHNNGDGGFGETGDQDIIKCGSFTTNGSGIADVNLGFEPQWIITKKTNEASDWEMFDMMRGWVHNTHQDNMDFMLRANLSNSEYSGFDTRGHPTATGFRWQYTSNDTYAYIAIRRPMAAAETGADVFKASGGNASSNQPPGWSSPTGFRVDASFDLWSDIYGNTDRPTFSARQIQGRYTDRLYENSGPQFYSWTGQNYDHQNGFNDGNDGGTGDLGYMWQRKPTAFDTFCFTGTGSNMTHTHNLEGEVGMAWWFTVSTTTHVYVYARPLGANKYLRLNGNSASNTDTILWQNTHPTDTNFYTGGGYNNTNQDHIVLLFGNAPGISKIGTFTGNGTNQNIDCGFSNGIRFLMIKKTNSTGNWYFWDEVNLGISNQPFWYIQYSAGLITNQDTIDTYSAGFNIKFNTNQSINTSGDTYLFYAVAA